MAIVMNFNGDSDIKAHDNVPIATLCAAHASVMGSEIVFPDSAEKGSCDTIPAPDNT